MDKNVCRPTGNRVFSRHLSTRAVVVLAALTFAIRVVAGEPPVGGPLVDQPAPPFELQDSEGQWHKLSDYKDKIVVLHFQSCACPWDIAYQPVLNRLARKFLQMNPDGTTVERVKFLAINANHSESIEQIKQYVVQTAMPYAVLKDVGNQVADAYAAITTPHIFVINKNNQQTLAYKGGIEKAPLSPPHCGESEIQYLEPVLWALLNGTAPPFSQTRSIGCSIKRITHPNPGG